VVQSGKEITAATVQLGQCIMRSTVPGCIPCGPAESIISMLIVPLPTKGYTEIIIRLGCLRAGVVGRDAAKGSFKVLLRLVEQASLAVEDAELGVNAGIIGVASEGFLIVSVRIQLGVIKLIQTQTSQIQLFNGFDFLGCGRRYNRLGTGLRLFR